LGARQVSDPKRVLGFAQEYFYWKGDKKRREGYFFKKFVSGKRCHLTITGEKGGFRRVG